MATRYGISQAKYTLGLEIIASKSKGWNCIQDWYKHGELHS